MSYARIRGVVELDEYSTYPNPKSQELSGSCVPTEHVVAQRVKAGVAGAAITYNIATIWGTSIQAIAIRHVDATVTDAVDVTWSSLSAVNGAAMPSDHLCAQRITSGGFPLVLTDVTRAVNLTLVSTAATTPTVEISIFGT